MRHCKQCGKEFTPTKSDHIYCSARCRTEHKVAVTRAKRAKKKNEPRTCEFCGKFFVSDRRMTKYCSSECRGKAMAKKRREKWALEPRTCKGCGNNFDPTAKNQIYCSKKCRKEYLSTREIGEKKRTNPYFLRRGPTNTVTRGLSSFFSGGEL